MNALLTLDRARTVVMTVDMQRRDVLRERFQQKAIYLKFVGPVEHLVVTEEEISDED